MRAPLTAVAVAAAALVAGCRNNGDTASYVGGLRLLAVKAEPPEIPPGQMTTLTATVANPGGTLPTVDWAACLAPPPPATGQSVNMDCVSVDGGAPLLPFGSGMSVAATMPMITIGMLGLPDQTNGFYLQVRELLSADGKQLVGFYGLRIYPGALDPNPPNRNPTFTGVFSVPFVDAGAADLVPLDEANPPAVRANGQIYLRATLSDDSQEPYLVYDGDPRTTPPRMLTEKVRMHWFATAGTFSNEVTGVDKPDTFFTLDKHLPSSGSTIDIWVVARDDRGGIDTIHRAVTLR